MLNKVWLRGVNRPQANSPELSSLWLASQASGLPDHYVRKIHYAAVLRTMKQALKCHSKAEAIVTMGCHLIQP